jgi:hypothetical protein
MEADEANLQVSAGKRKKVLTMQEEIKKHAKKIFIAAISPTKSFMEKLKEIFIEVLIIIFAVTLSIKLHAWSEHNHQQEIVKEFYKDEINSLKSDIGTFEISIEMIREIYRPIEDSTDTKEAIQIRSIKRFPNSGNFEGFKSGGNFAYIENNQIRTDLMNYHTIVEPSVEYIERATREWVSDFRNKLDYPETVTRDILFNEKNRRNTLQYVDQLKSLERQYQTIKQQAEALKSKIEEEIK